MAVLVPLGTESGLRLRARLSDEEPDVRLDQVAVG